MGYDGDLELALIPESFRRDVLKETLDSNGVLIESRNDDYNGYSEIGTQSDMDAF